MNIESAVAQVARMSEDGVLVAKPPFTWASEALFVDLTDDYHVPQPVKDAGFEYLLGRSDIEMLVDFLRAKKISSRAAAEFVIHYAITDSTPAWIDDVPDAGLSRD